MAKKLIDKVDDDTFDRPRLAKSILKKTPSKRIPPSDIGKTSSIGDVGTIRSRLHERRTQLNKEITVENRIKQGSKKLSRMSSLDEKTRDQAKIELEFSESKIHVLQTELSRINSSIQAYQPKSVRNSQVPLIPIALKTAADFDYTSVLSDGISTHYFTDPKLLQDSIDKLQNLRKMITTPTKDQAGIDLLYEYFSNFLLVAKRFLQPNVTQGFVFIWHDAINGLPASQRSTAYEKACVIFNIGALHTQIAAQQDRSSDDGIDIAIKHLEHSLGVFEYMKHNFSYSPTLDMTDEILSLISDLMRAQIVELQWEKTVLKGLNDKDTVTLVDYAQKNKLISECYKPIRELVEDQSLKEYIPSCWSAMIKIKDAHYKSQAHYYASIIHGRLGLQSRNGGESAVLALRRASLDAELHFMYTADTTKTEELFSSDYKIQIGLAKSHLNCAMLLHEYALRFKLMSKELDPIEVLQTMLDRASRITHAQKDAIGIYDSTAMIAPTIESSIIELYPVLPDFTRIKVPDLFKSLGPMPYFSAENVWSKPRTVIVVKRNQTYGFALRGGKPARISAVDKYAPAQSEGVSVGDWVLSINGQDIKHSSHTEIVQLVQKADGGDLVMEITTPISISSRKLSTPNPSPCTPHGTTGNYPFTVVQSPKSP